MFSFGGCQKPEPAAPPATGQYTDLWPASLTTAVRTPAGYPEPGREPAAGSGAAGRAQPRHAAPPVRPGEGQQRGQGGADPAAQAIKEELLVLSSTHRFRKGGLILIMNINYHK